MPFDGYPSAEFTAKNRGKFDLSSYQKMVLFDSICAILALIEKIDMCRFTVLFLWFSMKMCHFMALFKKIDMCHFMALFDWKCAIFMALFKKKIDMCHFLVHIRLWFGYKKVPIKWFDGALFNLSVRVKKYQLWYFSNLSECIVESKSAVDMVLFRVSVVIDYSNTYTILL